MGLRSSLAQPHHLRKQVESSKAHMSYIPGLYLCIRPAPLRKRFPRYISALLGVYEVHNETHLPKVKSFHFPKSLIPHPKMIKLFSLAMPII